eukprot:gb/GEZN01001878.1/.p1 GENE.gb/GEZN01001878.1/~~gb/GEZN01001878.1/.p1  ORF type:complete len:764 (+),score=110.72 gb/GEZN01001878.1/:23-2314(+)
MNSFSCCFGNRTKKDEATTEKQGAKSETPSQLMAKSVDDDVDDIHDDEKADAEEEKKGLVKLPSKDQEPKALMLVRKEIRYMKEEEQNRYVYALKEMMKNENGPGTSVFYRLAGYHGWPASFCHHQKESFPAWHRAYLVDFERELSKADKKLGNDGKLGLPYWDWQDEVGPRKDHPEFFPKIITKHFSSLPDDFAEKDSRFTQSNAGHFKRDSEDKMKRSARRYLISKMANDCLATEQHFIHASTEEAGNSIESPHNMIHVTVGAPMNSVPFAAFDPIFWLHHCNVDRIYEKYLELQPDSAQEFSEKQASNVSSGVSEENLFTEPLRPFKHPFTGAPFLPIDSFSIKALGYSYDKLPGTPVRQLEAKPTFAVFPNITVTSLGYKTWSISVFVHKEGVELKVPGDESKWDAMKEFAGATAVFGGKEGCENCLSRDPFDLRVRLNEALQKQNLSMHNAALTMVCIDENGVTVPFQDTKLPTPLIRGPLFENAEEALVTAAAAPEDARQQNEIKQLQRMLNELDCYIDEEAGVVDGWFGENTKAAVAKAQTLAGLEPTGLADAKLKAALTKPRFDIHKKFTKAGKGAPYQRGNKLRYWVGPSPGYLKRRKVLEEVRQAFNAWAEPAGLKFKRVLIKKKANVEVLWHGKHYHSKLSGGEEGKTAVQLDESLPPTNHLLEFDGRGGQLAHSTQSYIHLDFAERWFTQDRPDQNPEHFSLLAVLVHEVGHVLGLDHASSPKAVMGPFYDPKHTAPVKEDIEELAKLYKK